MLALSVEYVKEIDSLLTKLAGIREEIKRRRLQKRAIDNEKRIQQRIEDITSLAENLPNILADMECAGEEHHSLYMDDDDLWNLVEELRRIIAEETAIAKSPITVAEVVIEPLQDGAMLITLLSDDHGYRFTVGAHVLSLKCFAEMCVVAQSHPQSRKVANTLTP